MQVTAGSKWRSKNPTTAAPKQSPNARTRTPNSRPFLNVKTLSKVAQNLKALWQKGGNNLDLLQPTLGSKSPPNRHPRCVKTAPKHPTRSAQKQIRPGGIKPVKKSSQTRQLQVTRSPGQPYFCPLVGTSSLLRAALTAAAQARLSSGPQSTKI